MGKAAATAQATIDARIGAGLRNIRQARGMSLIELAERTRLSVGFLSQIERGKSSPTLRALASVADALGVGLADVFPVSEEGRTRGATIVRLRERSQLTLLRSGIRKQLLTSAGGNSELNLYLVELEPGASTGEEFYSHGGNEAGLVLSGAILLCVEAESWTLREGDSFRFASSRPHRFANATEGHSNVLWVNAP